MSDTATVDTDALEQLAARLEEECPYETVSNVLTHPGWLDLLETIKTVWPEAYEVMRKDVEEPHAH